MVSPTLARLLAAASALPLAALHPTVNLTPTPTPTHTRVRFPDSSLPPHLRIPTNPRPAVWCAWGAGLVLVVDQAGVQHRTAVAVVAVRWNAGAASRGPGSVGEVASGRRVHRLLLGRRAALSGLLPVGAVRGGGRWWCWARRPAPPFFIDSPFTHSLVSKMEPSSSFYSSASPCSSSHLAPFSLGLGGPVNPPKTRLIGKTRFIKNDLFKLLVQK